MRVVLDTNVLISGIFWKGSPYKVLENWVQDKYEILLTDEIFDEYHKTLIRISKGKKDELVNGWIMFIAENGIFMKVNKRFKLSVNPDDNKFIECAVAGSAQYIVSGDSHLLDLQSVMNIPIVKPEYFLRLISKKNDP